MTRLVAFSRYLAYEVGGAEKSTIALLEERVALGDEVTVISVADGRFLGRRLDQHKLPFGVVHELLNGMTHIGRFSYLEYLLNRRRLIRRFSKIEADELWTYGIWAPAAALAFRGKIRYFVRSETDLGIVGNYFNGVRSLLKFFYTILELPAIAVYRADLKRIAAQAEITANSRYMANRVQEILGVNANVIYPSINIEPIRAALACTKAERKWIVFVGDNVYKGLPIVRAVANMLPDLSFRIVSRLVDTERVTGNITWMPWQNESWKVYEGAQLVIAPSQWEEAYCRTAREAVLLDIPVLVSKAGGLPEAVENVPSRLVVDYRNAKAWASAIKETINTKDLIQSQSQNRLGE